MECGRSTNTGLARSDIMLLMRATVLTIMLLAMAERQVGAQSAQRLSVQGSALYLNLLGDAFVGADAGYGFEAQVRFTPSALSLGAGFQYTSHAVVGSDKRAKLVGGFFEPRYVFSTSSSTLFPYLSGRFYVVRLTSENTGANVRATSTGLAANGGGGVLIRVGSRVNVDLGATYGYVQFTEFEFEILATGVVGTGEGNHGSNVVARVGLTLGL
jgi:hypothetical protein